MLYIDTFQFPTADQEFDFLLQIKRKCYDSFYPFKVLSLTEFEKIECEPITILYGGNGCGKTTALNVIAEKAKVCRESIYNRTNFFEDYVGLCKMESVTGIPEKSSIMTSDDVFDYMLNVRNLNEGIHSKREDLFDEYLNAKYARFQFKSLKDYDELKKVNEARSNTQSNYVNRNLIDNVRELSNGESAYMYFTEKIEENKLYLLDEPENSLSPKRQLELVKFIEDSARFFGCQFIISTHSPFILAIKGAKIYDMDASPVAVRKWTELKNVRLFYDFFKQHEKAFLKGQDA
ncbi:AAA family ATPase [Vallitalea pronyensis]|uniref:AAA family ATPase n=1 Tax=Vallitalea pronyensis TaxID=1348613 RepID=A0A8J8MQ02_9FIRM|nr:AAA family ATPase [Vallitalea pronyensis]QUI25278.1 AAA family ATPase [Vallitalea pronyensis]